MKKQKKRIPLTRVSSKSKEKQDSEEELVTTSTRDRKLLPYNNRKVVSSDNETEMAVTSNRQKKHQKRKIPQTPVPSISKKWDSEGQNMRSNTPINPTRLKKEKEVHASAKSFSPDDFTMTSFRKNKKQKNISKHLKEEYDIYRLHPQVQPKKNDINNRNRTYQQIHHFI